MRLGSRDRSASASMFLTGLGSTETAPYAIGRIWESKRAAQRRPARRPAARRQARAERRQAGTALRGPEHHAGLLARARTDRRRRSTRKASTSIGDAVAFEDPNDPEQGPAVRRPHRRRTSSSRPAPGSRRAACARRSSTSSRRMCATWCWPAPTAIDLGALIFPDIEACRALSAGVVGDAAAGRCTIRSRRGIPERGCSALAKRIHRLFQRACARLMLHDRPAVDGCQAKQPTRARSTSATCCGIAQLLVEELYADPPSRVITLQTLSAALLRAPDRWKPENESQRTCSTRHRRRLRPRRRHRDEALRRRAAR